MQLCGFLTGIHGPGQTSVSGFGPFALGNGKTGNHGTQGWMVPRFKLVVEINRKYLPLTEIELGHLALKSVNLYKQYYVHFFFQFFTVHIVAIHNNHQHMHTFSFDTIKL